MAHLNGDFEAEERGGADAAPDITKRVDYAVQRKELLALVTQHKEAPPILLRQPEWNKDIKLTFDDSLRNARTIIEHLHGNGIFNYRFYGESGTAIRTDVLADMGIEGLQRSTRITPGRWLTEYVDPRRGGMSREEYMRRYMIKSSPSHGTDYLAEGRQIRDTFMRLYPDRFQEIIEDTFGYHAAFLHPPPTDQKNHIQYWTPDQIREDIETYETFIRAWLDIPKFHVRHARTPGGGGFGYEAQFNPRWQTETSNEGKLTRTLNEFRPDATWDMWSTNSYDAVRNVDWRGTARSAVKTGGSGVVLLHSNYYDQVNLWKIDRFARELGDAHSEKHPAANYENLIQKGGTITVGPVFVRSAPEQNAAGRVVQKMVAGTRVYVHDRVPGLPGWLRITWGTEKNEGYIRETQVAIDGREKPPQIPDYRAMRTEMGSIEKPYRHYFSSVDREFILSTIRESSQRMNWSRDQYLIVVNRAEQFAALVYYSHETNQYYIVGDFGSKTSTGKQDVAQRTWATPLGLYDRKAAEERRIQEGKPEWRTEGKGGGGLGPLGSRVFELGKVDVQSPYGKPLAVALHKPSRASRHLLGEVAASHGCIRADDAFIDLVDRNFLLDGEYGRYILVGDSRGRRYTGDFNQV